MWFQVFSQTVVDLLNQTLLILNLKSQVERYLAASKCTLTPCVVFQVWGTSFSLEDILQLFCFKQNLVSSLGALSVTYTCTTFHRLLLQPFPPSPVCSYTLNTCVDPPHSKRVTSLTFQPRKRVYTAVSDSCGGSSTETVSNQSHRAVSTSLDGTFKTWVLVDSEWRNRGKTTMQAAWACRSIGDFHQLPCLGSAFCQDGSLLALNFQKVCSVLNTFGEEYSRCDRNSSDNLNHAHNFLLLCILGDLQSYCDRDYSS